LYGIFQGLTRQLDELGDFSERVSARSLLKVRRERAFPGERQDACATAVMVLRVSIPTARSRVAGAAGSASSAASSVVITEVSVMPSAFVPQP